MTVQVGKGKRYCFYKSEETVTTITVQYMGFTFVVKRTTELDYPYYPYKYAWLGFMYNSPMTVFTNTTEPTTSTIIAVDPTGSQAGLSVSSIGTDTLPERQYYTKSDNPKTSDVVYDINGDVCGQVLGQQYIMQSVILVMDNQNKIYTAPRNITKDLPGEGINIADMYYGNTKIKEAYSGSTLVWSNTPSPYITTIYYSDGTPVDPTTISNPELDNKTFYNAGSLNQNISGTLSFDSLTQLSVDNYFRDSFYENVGISELSFPELTTIEGTRICTNMFYDCNTLVSVRFPKLIKISGLDICASMFEYFFTESTLKTVDLGNLKEIQGGAACSCMFYGRKGLESVNLNNLISISNSSTENGACASMFQSCVNLQEVFLNNLTSISGRYCCQYMFAGTKIESINFNNLSTISGGSLICRYMFQGCKVLSSVSFPVLTTSSFGSHKDQFKEMFNSLTGSTSGSVTVHFPSNLESTIKGLTGYPLFGGKAGYITLAFDLPATV